MKKLLILLFSLFFLSSPSVFADDISDFEIEGISIGDSLLNYMTKEEILEEIELNKDGYSYLKEPNKYVEVYLFNYSSTYEAGLSFFIKNNSTNKYINNKNEKYTILSIRGMKNYIEDFDSCIQKRDEIAADLSHVFPFAQKAEDFFKHGADPSGNSIVDGIYFRFESGGEGEVSCLNFEETFRTKVKWSEGLDVAIDSAEVVEWLSDH
jgi:hypothetical protein